MVLRRLFLTVWVLAALLACRRAPKPSDWDEEPLEPGRFLIEIDGTSDSDVWVLSNNATYHYDGGRWSAHNLVARKLSAVAADDVWFGGYMGTVVHFDGRKFESFPIEAAKKAYRDVSSVAAWPGEVWVTFNEPGYYRHEGAAWVHVEPPALRGWKIEQVWGKKSTDVWAAINQPGSAKVAHLAGGSWTIYDKTPGFVFAGSATNDVWFGGMGTMVHWDGTKLTDHPSPKPKARLYGLAVRSPTDALAVGPRGVALRWDGSTWSALPAVSNYELVRAFAAPGARYRALYRGSVLVSNRP
jgi:hypothetical protein